MIEDVRRQWAEYTTGQRRLISAGLVVASVVIYLWATFWVNVFTAPVYVGDRSGTPAVPGPTAPRTPETPVPAPLVGPTDSGPGEARTAPPTGPAATKQPKRRATREPKPKVTRHARRTHASAPAAVHYRRCADVPEALKPLRADDPGYRPGLDRDGDGEACER